MISSISCIIVISVALLQCNSIAADLPPEVTKCRAGDVKCIAKIIPEILHRYPNGNSQFGLMDVQKVQLKDVIVSEAKGNSPVQLNLKFNKLNVIGLENVNVTRVVGFDKDPLTSKFEVYGFIPELAIDGDYESEGKLLILPMNAKGLAQIQFKNLGYAFKVKLAADRIEDGKQYIKFKNIKSKLEPEQFKVKFDNLFPGNKELGDNMNSVINENWKSIWLDMENGINTAISEIVKYLLVNVIKVLPYDDFYSED